jgi:hypothetical protein
VYCQDEPSGLRAIIAIYSTALGPGLGGTRFYPYADEDAALADVLNLSRAMAYKNALAGLDLGGGVGFVTLCGYITGTVPLVASSIDWHGAKCFPRSMLGDQVFNRRPLGATCSIRQ